MAYDPKGDLAAAHGMDAVVVASDARLASRRGEQGVDSTAMTLSVPPFLDLGAGAGEWREKVLAALGAAGFETFWKCAVRDEGRGGAVGETCVMSLSGLDESHWMKALPEAAERLMELEVGEHTGAA